MMSFLIYYTSIFMWNLSNLLNVYILVFKIVFLEDYTNQQYCDEHENYQYENTIIFDGIYVMVPIFISVDGKSV